MIKKDLFFYLKIFNYIWGWGVGGLGIGDWGLGIVDCELGQMLNS